MATPQSPSFRYGKLNLFSAAVGASSGPPVAPAAFANFDQPGFAKIAFNLRVEPYGASSSILTIETRVALTDPQSLRRFRRYWILIAPPSDLIRRIALRLVAADLRRFGYSQEKKRLRSKRRLGVCAIVHL